eukprot:gb/GEZN01010831.1/.p1 GENE.gb/GEZN01010831.1/~~gb/GEZN01010831.1/.p1  ORF type:complete len:180 (+),score=3.65 gb/GEZN01010831.1/:220-759(+)
MTTNHAQHTKETSRGAEHRGQLLRSGFHQRTATNEMERLDQTERRNLSFAIFCSHRFDDDHGMRTDGTPRFYSVSCRFFVLWDNTSEAASVEVTSTSMSPFLWSSRTETLAATASSRREVPSLHRRGRRFPLSDADAGFSAVAGTAGSELVVNADADIPIEDLIIRRRTSEHCKGALSR